METEKAIAPSPEQLADEYLKALQSLGEEAIDPLRRHIANIIQSAPRITLDECTENFVLIKRNTHKVEPAIPGMYLKLFHGRTPCDLEMDDWGEDGPWIGPIEWIHFTYQTSFRIGFLGDSEYWSGSENQLPPSPLYFYKDCIYYDGIHYGDWEIISIPRVTADIQ